jgi:eukaryotic-like serine/threonine-protein kinase
MRAADETDWRGVQSLFEELVDLAPSEQARMLGKSKHPAHIVSQAADLLAASHKTGILDMAAPAMDRAADSKASYTSLGSGQAVGGFTIEKLIGRGGMGEVYLACRASVDFDQLVALKLLRAEAADRGDQFMRERRLLARLEHPGISRLIDAGIAPDGRPYMAMEYIDGYSIDQYCRDHGCSLQQRLNLFRDVCDAVAYAHAKLIVHRDIKPSNIMIDKSGKVRLLDFGIAKLLDETSLVPATTQAMLTPDYAAPEQLDGDEPTVSADIYALGIVLYELICGKGPWRRNGASLPTIIRRVLYEDPALPSKAAADLNAPVPASQIAGDLDAIIMKAMRRNPAERYRSVIELATDVRRHQELKPVHARDGSTRYMIGRFVRRYRWAVAASSAALTALIIGAAGIALQARETARQRDNAFAEARRIEAANQAFMGMFQDASDSARFQTTTMRQMMDGTRERMISSLRPESPNAVASISALADLYLTASANDDARKLLTQALARGFGRSDPADLARLKLQLSTVEMRDKQTAKARQLLDQSQAVWNSDTEKYLREIVISADVESTILWNEGKPGDAIALLQANMDRAEKANSAYERDLVWYYHKLANYLVEEKRLSEASSVISHGLKVLNSRDQAQTDPALLLRRFQAEITSQNGDDNLAARMLKTVIKDRRRLFGPSLALAVDLLKLGQIFVKIDMPNAAIPLLTEAAPMSALYFGINSDPTFQISLTTADALADSSRLAEANAMIMKAVSYANKQGAGSISYGLYLRTRANLNLAAGDLGKAEADLNSAEAIFLSKGSRGDKFRPAVAKVRNRLERARTAV